MYRFTDSEVDLANTAQAAALERINFPKIMIPEVLAQQFLSREIVQLIAEGEDEPDAIAGKAVARLREYLQVKESVRRLSGC